IGHPRPTRRRRLPVKFAIARCVRDGSLPALHAMTASTANSGSVCSHARIASASPCDMRNCAASAPQAMTNEEMRMLGNVQSADQAEVFGIIKRLPVKTITSRQNAWFQRVRDAIRDHAAEIVIEGPKAVEDAIAVGLK